MGRARKPFVRARLYYPDPRYVQLRLRNDDVHEPPNPSPSVLPPQPKALWDHVENQSWDIYGEHAEQHKIPEKTAWKAVRMFYEDAGGQWVPKAEPDYELPYILPDPGDVAWLGKLIEYVWIDGQGGVYKRTFSEYPPDLWWNDVQKTLYSFPTAHVPEHCLPIPQDLKDTAHMFKRWAQRDAECSKEVTIPMVRLYPRGAADSVSYRSDKWNDKNPDIQLKGSNEYIHMHGDKVWVWEDCPEICDMPNAVMFRGGRLDVEERGIIH